MIISIYKDRRGRDRLLLSIAASGKSFELYIFTKISSSHQQA